ncbi:MAG: sugar ABC transporter ATP-binding protein [Planctomycetota bacterium]
MRAISKAFGTTIALDGVDLEVRAGEVHALVGENGAGKSTLMKVVSGAVRPDAGEMWLAGEPFRPASPLQARDQGIAMIYQELTLAPHLSVEANIMLGRELTTFGFIRSRRMRPAVSEALALLEHSEISPARRVDTLSPAARQLVEVARALASGARVIVLDEPTSSLSRQDTKRLFDIVRRLALQGVALVYVSHFLDEVKEIGDRYTVLRDGRAVATGELATTALATVVEQMVGRKLQEVYPRVPHEPGAVVLRLEEVAGEKLPLAASLELRRGEILGITGLVGAGRTELLRAIFGLEAVRSGRIIVAAFSDRGAAPGLRLAQGVGLLSENRKEEGLAVSMSVAANLTLSKLEPFRRSGLISLRLQRQAARTWIERLGIRTRGATQAVADLSGGNQQKVAIARLLHHDVDVLLLDEPTRGIDVGSKVEIYRLMGELAARGKGVLFVSSYIPELLGVCDRIAVMRRGVLGAARSAAELSEETILAEATGATS